MVGECFISRGSLLQIVGATSFTKFDAEPRIRVAMELISRTQSVGEIL